ncbi:MAG: sulfatase [Phycisphaeraceae bacterium]|nr:sulfatase [Phycisphaeraceae bacterium]
MSRKPPNILLIHCDQHRFDCVGANGHPLVQTPHLDRLAAEGVNFTHAFTPTAICSPARASLLTGTFPCQHGCIAIPGHEHYRPARGDLPKFPPLLAERGYRLGYVGRYHNEVEGDPTDFGFETFIANEQYGAWRAAQGLAPPPGGAFRDFFGVTDDHVAPEQTEIAWLADHVIDLLNGYAGSDDPFMLRWDTVEPHLPCVCPEPYASMYDPASIAPWPGFDDPLEGKPWIQAQQPRNWGVDGWDWARWAPTVAYYLGVISLLDAQVGRVLEALDRLDLAERTLVVYTADHGDLCGGHGMVDKHFVMYDDVQRVPLIARWPAGLEAGGTCEDMLIQEIDLASTFCDAAAAPVPSTFEGRSILRAARGEDTAPRADVFGEWSGGQFGLYSQRMVRDRRWKYVWNCTDVDELYDLETDPGEIRNLAGDPTHAEQLQRLRLRLVAWMEKLGDVKLNIWTRPLLEGRDVYS